MKTKTIILVVVLNVIITNIHSQINMNSAGLVGIGTTPQTNFNLTTGSRAKFYNGTYSSLIIDPSGNNYGLAIYPSVNNTGNIGLSNKAFSYVYSYGGSITLSDKRQKENISSLSNSLGIILKLQGVKYDLKKEYAYSDTMVKDSKVKTKLEKSRKNKIGFLAQDVFKVIPEVVVYDDSTDIYGICYERIIPVLVEAIKEQQKLIEELQSKVSKISENALSSKSEKILTDIQSKDADVAALSQNSPNPFNKNTIINFYLPQDVKNAIINVYDVNGIELKSYNLGQRGYGSININASELKAGLYYYNLISDNKLIDSKKMILTD